MSGTTRSLLAAIAVLATASVASAHCQIPCGIYHDELRIQMIEEHATTIEKSMNQINELGRQTSINYNQLVRWVSNKEEHAQKVQDVVTGYFMAQRVKLPTTKEGKVYQDYLQRLTLLHELLVTAMKAKQGTDVADAKRIKELARDYRKAYLAEEDLPPKMAGPTDAQP